jgi:hypothetical protein
MWRNPEFYSFQGNCKESQPNDSSDPSQRTIYPGRYITLRRVAKSMAVSEDRMRGQPLGDSAAARLVGANIRRSVGEWRDKTLVWTRNSVFPAQHFHAPVLKIEGFMRGYGYGVDGRLVVRSICDRGVEGRLVIRCICDREVGQSGDADGRRLGDGRCTGTVSVSRVATDSSGGGWGIRGSGSPLGSPRDVGTGVAAGPFWFVPVGFDLLVVNTGGGGRPSQPRSRNATTSWKVVLARWRHSTTQNARTWNSSQSVESRV